jgi:hypothetical protein
MMTGVRAMRPRSSRHCASGIRRTDKNMKCVRGVLVCQKCVVSYVFKALISPSVEACFKCVHNEVMIFYQLIQSAETPIFYINRSEACSIKANELK